MPHAGTYVLACLISGVSAALILASGPSHTESRSPQDNVNGGRSTYDGCRAGPCQIAYCMYSLAFHPLMAAEYAHDLSFSKFCGGFLLMGTITSSSFSYQEHGGSRVIPDGTILGAHFVITPEFVQITGVGKLTNINVPPDGVVSASGQSYSDHRIVVTSVYGQLEQISEWTVKDLTDCCIVVLTRFDRALCRKNVFASEPVDPLRPHLQHVHRFMTSLDARRVSRKLRHRSVRRLHCGWRGGAFRLVSGNFSGSFHRSAHPFSHCTSRGTIGNAQLAHARRAIAPVLATSLSQSHLSLSHSTPVSSCLAPTTTDTTTIPMTSSSFPTSTLNATSFMNFSMSSTNAPTFTMCSYNHTHTHTRSHCHSHTHRRSHHHSSAFSATSSSSSSYHSFSHSPSPRTASSLNDSSSMSLASSSPISSTPSFTFTFSTFYSSGPLAGTATPSASTPLPTPSLPSSSYGTSSSLPGPPTPPSSYGSSTSSSVSSTVSSSVSSQSSYILTFTNPSLLSFPATSPATSSSTSYVLTFTTPSLSVPTTSPASSPSPVSPSTSSSPSSSTSSQTSYVLPFTTPSSSDPTVSPTSSSPTVPNSQTQIGSQCPPLWNAGSVSSIPLPPLTLAILMIVISSSVGSVVS
ncbi:hypothetical protein JVT61DRAFT_15270 [Boletus reticuloceps]|uniref:Uncharacterized protein n=1 Tax=Boletus reticuloceps TaxID=495285 RepID=A0A8I2YR03_9AGAM|nr:hypothetical protein JVT61DRAFT_15270 [Boletus reticuloceps]